MTSDQPNLGSIILDLDTILPFNRSFAELSSKLFNLICKEQGKSFSGEEVFAEIQGRSLTDAANALLHKKEIPNNLVCSVDSLFPSLYIGKAFLKCFKTIIDGKYPISSNTTNLTDEDDLARITSPLFGLTAIINGLTEQTNRRSRIIVFSRQDVAIAKKIITSHSPGLACKKKVILHREIWTMDDLLGLEQTQSLRNSTAYQEGCVLVTKSRVTITQINNLVSKPQILAIVNTATDGIDLVKQGADFALTDQMDIPFFVEAFKNGSLRVAGDSPTKMKNGIIIAK